jgi:hypothetical protein
MFIGFLRRPTDVLRMPLKLCFQVETSTPPYKLYHGRPFYKIEGKEDSLLFKRLFVNGLRLLYLFGNE